MLLIASSTSGRSLLLISMLVAPLHLSAQDCATNFTEEGDRSTGIRFKSFLEIKGAKRSEVIEKIAQQVALDGWQGLSVSKEIGVISAFQAARGSGKQSPLNVVVTEADQGVVRAEVVFQLLGGLRASSASARDEFCKLLQAALPAGEKAAAAQAVTSQKPRLLTGTTETPLAEIAGDFRKAGYGPVVLLFLDFRNARSKAKAAGPRPTIAATGNDDPHNAYLLVRLDSDEEDNRRSLKMGSAGAFLKMAFKGGHDILPDEDWTISFTTAQEAPGKWRITPDTDLKPGQYGLFEVEAYLLYDFEVTR